MLNALGYTANTLSQIENIPSAVATSPPPPPEFLAIFYRTGKVTNKTHDALGGPSSPPWTMTSTCPPSIPLRTLSSTRES